MTHTLDLFKYMHEGAVIVTPNNRLSAHLIQTYDQLYRPTQIGPLIKPLCFSYEAWLHYLYHQISQSVYQQAHPILLSSHQQRYLWQMIIHQYEKTPVSAELLEMIQDAWKRCIFWKVNPDHPALQQTHHTRRFQRWYQAFQQTLITQNAMTVEQIPDYLMKIDFSIQASPVIWTCFDEFTPLQKCLQTSLSKKNCLQLFDDYQEKFIEGECFPAATQQEECEQAIAWARHCLAEGDQNIAIIVPDLQKQIHGILTVFSKHFSSDLYNISYGKPLSDYPIISTALQWLMLDLNYLSAHQIRLLLQSPYIQNGQTEFAARSQLLQDSPIMKSPGLPWKNFLIQIKTSAPHLHTCLEAIAPFPKAASPYAWSNHFKQRLHALGFPGETAIDSSLYQCLNRFYLLFDELMSLTAITTSMSAQNAIQTIEELSSSVLFQVQKPPTPVTVLGMLEASGCRYDRIWITGLTDQCLPQKTKFSPFLPIHLQKKLMMPHTDAQNEFSRAELVLRRFGYASRSIVYSYPLTMSDQPQLPCTLISQYPYYAAFTNDIPIPTCALTTYPEAYSHPKLDEKFSGGTALLASQAKCPFQAFAAHRLKIRTNPVVTDGLDLAERGQILHRVMETIWIKLEKQAHLLKLSSEQLDTLIQQSIHSTLQAYMKSYPSTLSAIAQDVEYLRLQRLVHSCLLWEKQRSAFQIGSLEQSYQINLAGLPLKVRVDRLDLSLHQSSKIVIDYKTSLPTTKPWLEERPEAPQLLLYALLDPSIQTLIFIQLKAGRITVQGLSAHPNEETGIQSLRKEESWSLYQQHWKQQLTLLANEVLEGHCEPKPKRSSICQQCSFQSLCRVT